MDFQMHVTPPSGQWNLTPGFEPSEDYDSLVMDCCGLLSQTDSRFHVNGFGQSDWPVDVAYDLSAVMEQLPEAVAALRKGENTEIDFYGQGIERLIEFSPQGTQVAVRCTSRLDWTPRPDVEFALRDDVERLLSGLAHSFKVALDRTSPEMAALEPFSSW
ncbi:hypothetical protein [Streptomyces sp. MZ04]|uniref:hypothetical protein n=1 Tax=Streptomyces sp. MZ04 TaxID=2559236 RepID=UPI00107ED10B|nr:hypothetical protein [Streptomyces sp. MZ04]TGB00992.1 hypothetical protein E2651_28070 [Streptomyces sp. MZ04]